MRCNKSAVIEYKTPVYNFFDKKIQTKYAIGQQIQSFVILCSFGEFVETVKNSGNYIISAFNKVQKL